MGTLIISEIRYNLWIFIGYITLSIAVSGLYFYKDFFIIHHYVLTFIAIYYWNIFSLVKENRLLQDIQLPIRRADFARLRIWICLMTALTGALLNILTYTLISFLLGHEFSSGIIRSSLDIVLYLPMFFFIYFICRDTLLYLFRHRFHINKEKTKTILVITLLVINLLGFIVLFTQPGFIGRAFDWIIHNWPFTGLNGHLTLLALTVITALLSLKSFQHKPQYLE